MPNDKDRSWLDALSGSPLNLGNYPGYAFDAAQFGGNALSNIGRSMSPVRFEDADGPSGQAGFVPQVPPMITETAGAWDRLFGEQDNWYDGPGEVYPGDMNADAATAALAFYGGNALNPLARRPVGSVGAGMGEAARNALPMDHASRMARAKEIGHDLEQKWYFGTQKTGEGLHNLDPDNLFDEVRRRRQDSSSFLTSDRELANSYSGNALLRGGGRQASEGAVYPLVARTDHLPVIDMADAVGTTDILRRASNYDKTINSWPEDWTHDDYTAQFQRMDEQSFRDDFADGLDELFDGEYIVKALNGDKLLAFRDPSIVRSVNAAFDPARAGENGLLLSDNKPSILGSALGTADNSFNIDRPYGDIDHRLIDLFKDSRNLLRASNVDGFDPNVLDQIQSAGVGSKGIEDAISSRYDAAEASLQQYNATASDYNYKADEINDGFQGKYDAASEAFPEFTGHTTELPGDTLGSLWDLNNSLSDAPLFRRLSTIDNAVGAEIGGLSNSLSGISDPVSSNLPEYFARIDQSQANAQSLRGFADEMDEFTATFGAANDRIDASRDRRINVLEAIRDKMRDRLSEYDVDALFSDNKPSILGGATAPQYDPELEEILRKYQY